MRIFKILPMVVVGVCWTFVAGNLYAQVQFSKPIPIRSAASQVGTALATKTEATNVIFFDHPKPPADGVNFIDNIVKINGLDVPIRDLAATPGLLPLPDRELKFNSSLLYYDNTDPTNPTNPGFCPRSLKTSAANTMNFNCKLTFGQDPNYFTDLLMSRQLEVADVRAALASEMSIVADQDPLLGALIGNAHEDVLPYTFEQYPATLIGKHLLKTTKDCSDTPPITCLLEEWPWPYQNYDEVTAYGAAELGGWVVLASHDPLILKMDETLRVTHVGTPPNPSWQTQPKQMGKEYNVPFLSPIIFFHKDSDSGRLKLAGYSNIYTSGTTDITKVLLLFLGQNFGSVSIVPIKPDTISQNGFAVVNNGSIVDLDGVSSPLRSLLSHGEAPSGLQPLGKDLLPHGVVSSVVFWGLDKEWGADGSSINPNELFSSKVMSPIGTDVFSAVKIEDTLADGTKKESVLVPSGDPVDGKYYIYKIDPMSKDYVYLDPTSINPSAKPLQLPIVVPKAYELAVPAGFAPYNAVSGDLNDDGCGDVAITFKGSKTIGLNVTSAEFENTKGQHVIFGAGSDYQPTDKNRMFSNEVRIYFGDPGNGCGVVGTQDSTVNPQLGFRQVFPTELDAQVAAVAVVDIDGTGTKGLLLGDLIPRLITDTSADSGKYTGFLSLFPMDKSGAVTILNPIKIRAGFAVGAGPVSADDILNIAKGVITDKIIGVGAISVDKQKTGDNIAVISGLPLMLPKNGCPNDTNFEVFSLGEYMLRNDIPSRCKPLNLPQTKIDGRPGRNGGAEFASYRPDEVLNSNGHWIVNLNDLVRAADTKEKVPKEISRINEIISEIKANEDKAPPDQPPTLPPPLPSTPPQPSDPTPPLPSTPPQPSDATPPLPPTPHQPRVSHGQIMPGPREITVIGNLTGLTALQGGGPGGTNDGDPGGPNDDDIGGTTGGNQTNNSLLKNGDCSCKRLTCSSTAVCDKLKALDESFAEIRKDYNMFYENDQTIECTCSFDNASFPGVAKQNLVSMSIVGDPLPDSADNLRPYAFFQNSGSAFLNSLDKTKMPFKKVLPLENGIRILPLKEENASQSVVASLNMGADLSNLSLMSDVVPDMTGTAKVNDAIINNMIQYKVQAFDSNGNLSKNSKPSGAKAFPLYIDGATVGAAGMAGSSSSASNSTLQMPGKAVHVVTIRVPTDYPEWITQEGYTPGPMLENQMLDVDAVKQTLKDRIAAGQSPTSDIFLGLPWEPYRKFEFNILQGTYGIKDDENNKADTTSVKFAFLSVHPAMLGVSNGGGCGHCSALGAVPATVDSVFPMALVLVIALGGIVVGRVRRSK